MIKAIIFDFFDVFRSDGYNRWLKKTGHEREGKYLEASERHDRGEYSEAQFFQAISDASGESVESIEHEMETGNELNNDLIDLLPELHSHVKLALLSNSSSAYLRNLLAEHDLNKYFDEIVISSEVGLIKPEPEVFAYIMKNLHLEPSECVFVDDNPKHVESAKAQGITALIYTSVPTLKRDLAKLL